jgi:hypothetical protein
VLNKKHLLRHQSLQSTIPLQYANYHSDIICVNYELRTSKSMRKQKHRAYLEEETR